MGLESPGCFGPLVPVAEGAVRVAVSWQVTLRGIDQAVAGLQSLRVPLLLAGITDGMTPGAHRRGLPGRHQAYGSLTFAVQVVQQFLWSLVFLL